MAIGAMLIIATLVNNGHDFEHHVYRIIVLDSEIRKHSLDLFITNEQFNESLPTFFYYSWVPYVVPVSLRASGVSSTVAYKISLAAWMIIFLSGIWRMFLLRKKESTKNEELSAIFLITSNYVFMLWVVRSAAAELMAYSLIPWVVISLQMRKNRAATLLFALQAATHPIVFVHCLIAGLLGAWTATSESLSSVLRRSLIPLILALAFASPFWVPLVLWKDAIVGVKGMPTAFEDSFLGLTTLINPFSFRTAGVWIFLVVLLVAAQMGRASLKPILLLVAFVISVASQTIYLRPVVIWLPLIENTLFVWRLMFLSCFVGSLFLLARSSYVNTPWLRRLACIAVLNVLLICIISTFKKAPEFLSPGRDQENTFRSTYNKSNRTWGVSEFFPNYSELPELCGAGPPARADYLSLREGVVIKVSTDDVLVSINRAPVNFVQYTFNGVNIAPYAKCDTSLVLGPFRENGTLKVKEFALTVVMYLRAIEVAAIVSGGVVILLVAAVRMLSRRKNYEGRLA
jgi:hypothetical protein